MSKQLLIVPSVLAFALGLNGCAAFKGPPGPKLYDNVVIVTKNENALVFPPNTEKEFVNLVQKRLSILSEREVEAQGDLKVVDGCGPRTLKVTQDITGITISGEAYSVGGMNPFRPNVTTTKKDDIRISTELIIEDCDSGKKIASYPYYINSKEATEVVRWLSEANVGYVYQHQHGPRQRQ